ncbi:hypothetical protein BDR26DRAFT_900582 [Obelidium mucronatum]|nr:hypothetical protein BDR26DRAFT_900582 [Obelidium mucronatum]
MSFKESRLKRHPFVLIQGNKISGTSLQLREYAQEQPPHAAPLGASQSHRSAAAPQRLNTAIDPSVALDQSLSLVDLDVKELDRAIARKLQHRIVYKPPTDEKRRSLIELHDSTVAAAMLRRKKRALQHDAAATDDEREYQLLAEAEQFYSGRSLIERKQHYTNTYTSRNAKEHASLPPAPPSTAPTAPKASKNIPSLFTDDEVFHVGGAVEPWAEAEKDAFNEFHFLVSINFWWRGWERDNAILGISTTGESYVGWNSCSGNANNPNNSNATSNSNNNSNSSLGNKDGGAGGKQPKKRKPGATGDPITGVVKYSIPPPMPAHVMEIPNGSQVNFIEGFQMVS